MRCFHCGQEIDDNAQHCMYCGTNQGAGATVVLDGAYNPYAEEPAVTNDAVTVKEEPVNVYAQPVAPVQEPVNAQPVAPVKEPVYAQPVVPVKEPVYAQPVAPVKEPVYAPTAPYRPAAPVKPVAPAAPAAAPVFNQNTRPLLQLATNRGLLKMFFLGLVTFGIYPTVIFSRIVSELNIVASRYDGRKTMPFMAMCSLAAATLGILPFVWYHNMCDRIGNELKRRGIEYKFGASSFWLWNILGSLIVVGPMVFMHKLMKAMNKLNEDFNKVG